MKNQLSNHITLCMLCFVGMLLGATSGLAQTPTLRATVVSYQQVNLSWDRLPATPESHIVERKEDGFGQNFVNISGVLPGTTFAYQDKTVQSDRAYIYRVTTYCDKSCGGTLPEVRVVIPPAPPANPSSLDAFYISGRGVTVTWIGNNSDGTNFLLERSVNGGGYSLLATVPYSRALSYSDGATSPGNQYCYRVKARHGGGDSGYSNVGCVNISQTRPTAPSGLSATVINARQINLAWTDNAGNETSFDIERSTDGTNFSKAGDGGVNATSFQDGGVNPNTKYWYRVAARNSGGISDYSNVVDATTPDVAPDAPQNLKATPVSNTQIDISWTDISGPYGNETGYELESSPDGNTFTKIADLQANETRFSHTNLSTLTRYWYRLRAKNAIGYSRYANVDATTFDVPPVAPTNLAASMVSSSQINLTWTDNATNETAFEIERSTNGTTFEKIDEKGPNTTQYQSTGLSPATKYWYRVRAKNNINPSAYTNVADATTKDVAPNPPRSLSATAISYQQINLAWADISSNETGFEIEISTDGSNFSKHGTTTANIINFESKNLKELTTYYYRVRAFNAIGNSAFSDIVSATTPKAPIPDKPQGLTATPVNFDLIQLKWSALSSNATAVVIERSRKPDADFVQIGNQQAGIIQFPDRDILDIYDHYYRIKALNSAGASPYSDVVKVSAGSIITGTEPKSQEDLIYAHEKILYVSLNQPFTGKLQILNTLGVAVKTLPLSKTMTINLSSLPSGIYIVLLHGEKKSVKQKVLLF